MTGRSEVGMRYQWHVRAYRYTFITRKGNNMEMIELTLLELILMQTLDTGTLHDIRQESDG